MNESVLEFTAKDVRETFDRLLSVVERLEVLAVQTEEATAALLEMKELMDDTDDTQDAQDTQIIDIRGGAAQFVISDKS